MAVRNVYWPQIEASVDWLVNQQILTPAQLKRLESLATQQAMGAAGDFTRSLDERLARELGESLAAGEGSVAWQERLSKVVDVTAAEAETIGRTYTHRAYHEGIDEVLSDPIVGDEFPYLLYETTGDSRTRETHRAMSGKVAYKDSPLAGEMRALVNEYNCRCTLIPISRDEALARGIDDDTGYQPPAQAEPREAVRELTLV